MSADDETPVAEGAYDAACAVLALYVDGYGEVRGLTAYQAAIRAVDSAAPLIAAAAENRSAVKALHRAASEVQADLKINDILGNRDIVDGLARAMTAIRVLARRIQSGEANL